MSNSLPFHYQVAIRRLIRFAAIGTAVGLLLGITSTEFHKSVRIGPVAQPVQDGRVRLELPAETRTAAGLSLQLSHGHAILLTGVLPLVFALSLFLVWRLGGRELTSGRVRVFFWPYVLGASGSIVLLVYRGLATFLTVRGGNYDVAAVDAGLFGGNHALRAATYGITHTLMALGALTLLFSLFSAAGQIGRAEAAEG